MSRAQERSTAIRAESGESPPTFPHFEYSRQVTVSVTTACSYSDFPCSYSFQLPRASLPPPHGRGGHYRAPVWSPGHIVPQGGRQPRAPWAEDMPVKPQNLTERSSCFRSWSDTKLLLGCTLRFWSLGILDQALTSKVSKLPEARLRICRCYII